ncbi:MAG: O-antigen ligase family protein [Terriglobales bacterium]
MESLPVAPDRGSGFGWEGPGVLGSGLGFASAALLAGVMAAWGWGGAALAVFGVVVLAWAGAHLAWIEVQTVLLAVLLLVPEVASGKSFGLLVPWSAGLTWTNFVIPAVALPLLAGAWWSGRKLWPRRWPALATWMLALLAWSLLTLAAASARPEVALKVAGLETILGHVVKLALFVLIGVALAAGGESWRARAAKLLLLGVGLNAAVGLAQAAGWVAALSPLAQGARPRATGLFYDANLYGVLMSWALLWLLCQPRQRGWRRWAIHGLTLAVAGNLIAAGSRAGYLACAAGCIVLLLAGRRRAVGGAVLLLLGLGLLFPAQSLHRMRTAAATMAAWWQAPAPVSSPAADTSTQQRLDTMAQALRQIAQHPVMGLGFGRALYLGVPAVGSGPLTPEVRFRGAQDMWLTVWAGTGPVGLVLLLMAVIAPWRFWWRAGRAAAPMLAGYAGVLTACLTQEALWNARLLALVVFLTAGIGMGWGRCE